MPVVGDRATRMGEAARSSFEGFLAGLQGANQHELTQGRLKALAYEIQDREQAKQTQGEMLALGEEERGQAAFQGVQRHMKKAADFLGLPVVPGQEQAAEFVNAKIRERVENIRRIGQGMSERAYLMFKAEQQQQIQADAMELRARYVMKDIQKAMTMDLGPGVGGEIPGMDMIRGQVEEVVNAYRGGQATGRDVMRVLQEARNDAAELTGAFYQKQADVQDLMGLAAPFQGTPLAGEAARYVAQYERGARSLVSAEDAIMRLRRGKTAEPTRQEIIMDAHKIANDRAALGEDYGQAYQQAMMDLTGQQPQQQAFDPQAIAQEIASGRVSRADVEALNKQLSPEQRQAILQAAQQMQKGGAPAQEAPAKPEKAPEQKRMDVATRGARVSGAVQAGQGIAREAVNRAGQAAKGVAEKVSGFFRSNEVDEVAVLERKIKSAKDTIERLKKNRKPSEGRDKRIKEVEAEVKSLEAELEKARG